MDEEEDAGQGPASAAAEMSLPEPPPAAEDEDDGGFSFPLPPVAADACIVPVYPIFGRPPSPPPAGEEEPETATVRVPLGRLLLEEREFRLRARQQDGRSASARLSREEEEDDDDDDDGDGEASAAGGDEELDGVPPETYCLWAPGGGGQASAPASPRRCRKSGSTGSVLRWRRISDRLVGRSHSDGKEKFVFLSAAAAAGPEPLPPSPPPNKQREAEGGGVSNRDGDAAAVGRQLRYYGSRGGGSGSRRRSYLPYKQELVGLFANVSGLRRSYHPF